MGSEGWCMYYAGGATLTDIAKELIAGPNKGM